MLKATYKKVELKFIQPAGTSRGYLTEKTSWIITLFDIENPSITGTGECSLIKGLSPDPEDEYLALLDEVCHNPSEYLGENERLNAFPSIRFGLEMAWLDLKGGGKGILYPGTFTEGQTGIPINGLIWMGSKNNMLQQVKVRIKEGFRCIKLKIGSLSFEEELALLKAVRNEYSTRTIELRVDANGAFMPSEALERLKQLSDINLHSIEQPVKPGNWELMAELCRLTPLPIALDEELFSSGADQQKSLLLETVKPQYIVLKPSMLGGFAKTSQWIKLAKAFNIGWWITSALESNIGLNALAQWTFTLKNPAYHGLGTGKLFSNNFPSQLYIDGGHLMFDARSIESQNTANENMSLGAKVLLADEFIRQWQSGEESYMLHTSGSTGEPKALMVSRKSMIRSAQLTAQALGLKKGDTALLCMPLEFVAGKMMVVRSLVLGLNLVAVKPSSNPLRLVSTDNPVDFAAMTPMQVHESLNDETSSLILNRIRILIIGGAPVSKELEVKLKSHPGSVYETYGMTETLTHIALRRLNGNEQSEYFKILPGISISTDKRGCLVIQAPHLDQPSVVTNDLVEIIDANQFNWLGRADHVINSGGVKISPEQLEKKLEGKFNNRFVVSSLPDDRLGRKVVLVVEAGPGIKPRINLDEISDCLLPYEKPREVLFLEKFPETHTGKINRIGIQNLIGG